MLRTIIRTASLFLLCALSSLTAAGQTTVVNPKVVEFDPSADHATLTAEGHALVTRYDLQIFLPGATQPISTASLGKPAADADGKIRVDFSTVLVGWPPANGTYEARVAAVGPTGSGQSDPSNPFDFQVGVTPPLCTFTLSTTAVSIEGRAGSSSVSVTASAGTCGWTAASNASWLTLATASGVGSASVGYSVLRNSTGQTRTATVSVGGKVLTVTQASVARPAPPKGLKLSSVIAVK